MATGQIGGPRPVIEVRRLSTQREFEQAVALQPNLAPARRELQTIQRTLDVQS